MLPSKNFKFIATFLMIATLLSGCADPSDPKKEALERGITHFENRAFGKAVIEFKNVLQIDAKTPEPYFYLGEIAVEKGELRKALVNYSAAIKHDPHHIGAHIQLGRFHVKRNNLAEASRHANEVIRIDPDNVDAIGLKAAVLYRSGGIDEARLLLVKTLKRSPGNKYSAIVLAKIYQEQRNTQAALVVLERANEVKNDNEIMAKMYEIYQARKESSASEKILQSLVENNPDDFHFKRLLSSFYSDSDQTSRAVQILRNAISIDPTDSERYQALIELYFDKFGYRKSVSETLKMIEANPRLIELKFMLVGLYRSNQQLDKAVPILSKILKNDPHDSRALMLSARISLQEKNYDRAITLLKNQPPSAKVHAMLASAYHANGDITSALKYSSKAVESNPDHVRMRLQFSSYLNEVGDHKEAINQLDNILNNNNESVPALTLKVSSIRALGNDAELESALIRLGKVSADTAVGPLGLGDLYLKQNKLPAALKAYEEAYRRQPDSSVVLREIVRLQIVMGSSEVAERRLHEVIAADPQHAFAHELLGTIYISRKDYPQAEEYLVQQLKVGSPTQTIYQRLAVVRGMQGNMTGIVQAFRDGLEKFPNDWQLKLGLGKAYLTNHDLDSAASLAEHGTIAAPPMISMKFRLLLAVTREQQGHIDVAISLYEELIQDQPNNLIAINNLSLLLVDHRQDDRSLSRASELVKQLAGKSQPILMDTHGWVNYRLGNYREAADILSAAVKQMPESAEFNYHLGMTHYRLGNLGKARDRLSIATAGKPDFQGAEEAMRIYQELSVEDLN